MSSYGEIFQNKRITQMGLGLLGRGIGDAQFLARHGAELVVTDKKSAEDLQESVAQLASFPNITLRLGTHEHDDFRERDLVLKGAGVPADSPYIQTARDAGVPVDMSASLFARIATIPMVGVTGTRGKSTVTHLVHAILVRSGRKTLLGGNVRGVSNLALLDEVTPEHVGVFELDSWQCQGLAEERSLEAPGVRQGPLSPRVAVFTTFMHDHMNYYKNDLGAYLADKAKIFLFQEQDDVLVIGRQALPSLEPYRARMRANVIIADETTLPATWSLQLPGTHNRYNAGVALATVRAMGVSDDVSRVAIEEYRALPGRLEQVGTIAGVSIYNDNNATTPDATAAALAALDPEAERRVVLIVGGADKGLDLGVLEAAVATHAKHVVCIPGSGTTRFVASCPEPFSQAATLREAFALARSYAAPGDIIVFSPAFASFGQYQNEYERNDEFMSVVRDAKNYD